MNYRVLAILAIFGSLLFGCNESEEYSSNPSNTDSRTLQTTTGDNASDIEGVNTNPEIVATEPIDSSKDPEQSNPDDTSQTDIANPDDISSHQSDNSQSNDTVCNALDEVDLMFMTFLGIYANDGQVDYEAAKNPMVSTISSVDEANEFAELYKLRDNAKNALTAIDYSNYAVKVAYIGYRDVSSYVFNISPDCKDSSLTLEVISAPAMDEMVSFWGVFIKLPNKFKDVDIVMEDKEVSFEAYYTYSEIPQLF